MRFAIRLAHRRNTEVIFLHIHYVLRASFWSDKKYEQYVQQSKDMLTWELQVLVKSVYRSMNLAPKRYRIEVRLGLDTVEGIVEYAVACNAAYICIGTRGAGTVKKLLGTNTSKLIARSPVPVLCVPSSYRGKSLQHILYASDMTDYTNEVARVVDFAKPLDAHVELLHLAYPYELVADRDIVEQALQQKTGYKISFHYQDRDIRLSLLEDIAAAVARSKPSVLVLFTNQQRSLFERIFLSSYARGYSFHTKVPLLSFPKAVQNKSGQVHRPSKKTGIKQKNRKKPA